MDAVVEITGVAHGGDGVCRIDDRVCFVPYAFPGDRVRVIVEREARGVFWGSVAEIVEASPSRTPDAGCCPYGGTCGACGWRAFAYPAQAEWKRRIVYDSLKRIGNTEADIEWVDDPALRLGYRTRAEFHGDGAKWGFYLRGTHDLQPVRSCTLCHDRLNAALARLWNVPMKDSVEITVNPDGDEILVWTKRPHERLKAEFAGVNTLRDRTDRAGFLFDGVPVVNGAFSQSSLLLNRLLVRTTHEMVGNTGSLLDLYCGNGNLSLGLTDRARVVGLDHNRAAVNAAASLGKGEYRVGDEGDFTEAIRDERWDTILLDPPRAGAKGIAWDLADARAGAIVYVSCDPATLARDVKTLSAGGWRLARIVAVDMFPYTPHVECVCRLERGG